MLTLTIYSILSHYQGYIYYQSYFQLIGLIQSNQKHIYFINLLGLLIIQKICIGVQIVLIYGIILAGLIILNKKFKHEENKDQLVKDDSSKDINQQINEVNNVEDKIDNKTEVLNNDLQQQSKQKQINFEQCNKQCKDKQNQKQQQPSILKYFYHNYLLRQSINIGTIIIIQLAFIFTNITISTQDRYETFVNNSIITKGIPLIVLAMLSMNLLFNQFLWIIQVKYDLIIPKLQQILRYLFPQSYRKYLQSIRLKQIQQKKKKQLIQKQQKQKQQQSKQQQQQKKRIKELTIQIQSQSKKQQDQVVRMLNKFIQTSTIFQYKQSPFLGIQQKQKQITKDALLGLFKVQQKRKVTIPDDAMKLRNKLIDQFWDQI